MPTTQDIKSKPKSYTSGGYKPTAMTPINEAVQQYQVSEAVISKIREQPGIPVGVTKPVQSKSKPVPKVVIPANKSNTQAVKSSLITSAQTTKPSVKWGDILNLQNLIIAILLIILGALITVVGTNLLNIV